MIKLYIPIWIRQHKFTRKFALWYFHNYLADDVDLDSYLLWQLGYKWKGTDGIYNTGKRIQGSSL